MPFTLQDLNDFHRSLFDRIPRNILLRLLPEKPTLTQFVEGVWPEGKVQIEVDFDRLPCASELKRIVTAVEHAPVGQIGATSNLDSHRLKDSLARAVSARLTVQIGVNEASVALIIGWRTLNAGLTVEVSTIPALLPILKVMARVEEPASAA